MAEIDTGLGWAASDLWLMSATGTVAEKSEYAGAYPLKLGNTVPNMQANGTWIYANTYDPNNWRRTYYAKASDDYFTAVFYYTNGRTRTCIVTETNTAQLYYTSAYDQTGITSINGPSAPTAYDSSTGLYYYEDGPGSPSDELNPEIPFYSTLREGLDAIHINRYVFTKDNPGYAVTCVAKWKTGSAVIETPILISSVSEYTDMSVTPSLGLNFAKLSVLRNGIRYYMSFYDNTSGGISTYNQIFDATGNEYPDLSLEQVFAFIADLEHAAILELDSPDPYQEETGASEEEGGDGEDLEDDPVEEETLPLPSVAGHGFCTVYVPSSQELGAMASYLWGGSFDVSQVLKLFSNPMDSILGLSAVPVSLTGTSEQIYLGGVALTGITMPKYTGRTSVKVDFGTVTVKERWGSYLDYAPYTDFSIYLPFIGIKPVKADDIMGKTVSLMYAIDILSGGCVAYLRPAGGSVLYEWSGQCAVQIPVTGRSYDNVFQSAMSVATATLAAVAAPASAPVLSGAVASAAVQAAASKPHIERSGTVNGITGFLGQLRPYLIRTIPEAYIPADQNKFIGYPAYINVDLAAVRGYNEVDSIHLENVTATGAELDEIETILKGGVIF